MNKVWVVQENSRMDYSPAESFGQVRFMTADEFRPMSASLKNGGVMTDIESGVHQFNGESDWLVLTGNPMMIGYAFHLVLSKYGQVRCLQWDRMRGEYKPYIFNATERA